MLSARWPLFDLKIYAPPLVLAYPRDEHLDAMIDIVTKVHDTPGYDWFWQNATGFNDDLPTRAVQHLWRLRSEWKREDWALPFVVFENGVMRGAQQLEAKDFPVLGTVETGSWLHPDHQGRGLGKRMRAAVLAFAFRCLGAEEAVSTALVTNHASNGVSRALGYQLNGMRRVIRSGKAEQQQQYLFPRSQWPETADPTIRIEGLEPCRRFFFADGD